MKPITIDDALKAQDAALSALANRFAKAKSDPDDGEAQDNNANNTENQT